MKQPLISALVAAAVSVAILWIDDAIEGDDDELTAGTVAAVPDGNAPAPTTMPPPAFRYTEALFEDVWVDASRQPGSDERALTNAASSVCFLTRVELSGSQGADGQGSCAIEIDDFTGFWQVIATAAEGGRSEIRCNARCLTWEPGGEEP